jgi:hypothetical protein
MLKKSAVLLLLPILCACGSEVTGSGNQTPPVAGVSSTVPIAAPAPAPAPAPALATSSWEFCANENGVCSFTGTRQVRYGYGSTFAVKTFSGSVSCSNAVFGDPLSGADKICESAPATVATAPAAPVTAAAPAPAPVGTNSVAAADCSYNAVQAAVNSAKPGTTVLIPAGDCGWGTSTLKVPGGIYLKGAGKTATTIRRSAPVADWTHSLMWFDCSINPGSPVALSDMNLVGYGTVGTDDMGVVLSKACVDFKVFNNKFSKFTFAALNVTGDGVARLQRGAIYKNEFANNYTVGRGSLGYGVAVYGNSQTGPLTLGTQDAVFIEDNTFISNRHSVASNAGARYVFRYNTLTQTNDTKDWGQIDAHGYGNPGNGAVNSTFSWEIYNNTFLSAITDGGTGWAMFLRGGDGVVFNNTFASGLVQAVGLTVETGCAGSYPAVGQTQSAYIWGNSHNAVRIYSESGNCSAFFAQGREYFFAARPGYAPYSYPHPLQNS